MTGALLERIAKGDVLICDGALGTMLQQRGLRPGECPESWCVSQPQVVTEIAAAYAGAGSEIVSTNSFGANRLKLKLHGFGDKVAELNRTAAELVRTAVGSRTYVAGSVGPTGQIVQEEGGEANAAELYDAFQEQIQALAAGGVDALWLETMSSLREATLAIRAAKENATLPVACTFTFQSGPKGFRTMMGLTPERAAKEALSAGADIVGANCSSGIEDMIHVARQMRAACPNAPLLIQPNAGRPVVEDGVTVFKETPESMAARVPELLQAGVNIVGGCCGTRPEHIAAIAKAVGNINAKTC